MKYIHDDNHPKVELTRRNLETLLAKLDDPDSERTIGKKQDGEYRWVWVKAVENDAHYADREPGPMLVNGDWA